MRTPTPTPSRRRSTQAPAASISPREVTSSGSPWTRTTRSLNRTSRTTRSFSASPSRERSLHPVGLEVSSSSIRQGDSVEIVATIENTGERSLDGFSVGFFVGDVRFATFTYRATTTADPGLEEEDRARVKGTLPTEDLVPGVYSLRVVADPDNRIPELDETNNQIRTTITILPPAERLAELYVSEVTLDPASPIPAGLPIVAHARVRNGGTMDAGRFSVAFVVLRDDGATMSVGRIDCSASSASADSVQVCACQSSTGLARGAAEEVEYTLWTAGWPEGRYALHVWVDPPAASATSGEVRELDEANNAMILSFSLGRSVSGDISAGVNLVVDAVTVQPASVPAGTLTSHALRNGDQPRLRRRRGLHRRCALGSSRRERA